METATSSYSGLALYRKARTIRVLVLHPGAWNSKLKGTLHVAYLDLGPVYDALSYTWGSHDDDQSIYIDGWELKITRNLYNALKRLRQRFTKICIWVDAVCIDQDNEREKRSQIMLMGEVYSRARSVLVWLGESHSIFTRLPLLHKLLFWVYGLGRPAYISTEEACAVASAIYETRPPWINRGWVVQEFFMASKVYLCYGPYRRHWTRRVMSWEFWDSCRTLHAASWSFKAWTFFGDPWKRDTSILFDARFVKIRRRLNDLFEMKVGSFAERGKHLPLGEASYLIRATKVTEPRDKLLCLYGLVDEDERLPDIDQGWSIPELFAMATRQVIAARRSYGILTLINVHERDSETQHALPSWTVDFAQMPDNCHNRCLNVHPYTLKMARRLPAHKAVTTTDNLRLTVRGFRFSPMRSSVNLRSGWPRSRHWLSDRPLVRAPKFDRAKITFLEDKDWTFGITCPPHLPSLDAAMYEDDYGYAEGLVSHSDDEITSAWLVSILNGLDGYGLPHFDPTNLATVSVVMTRNRCLGYMIGRPRPNDAVYLIRGSHLPMILRPSSKNPSHYEFRGFARFMHLDNDGFIRWLLGHGVEEEEFVLC